MKLIFAAATAAAADFASMPANAASVISAGLKPVQECAKFAGQQSLSDRQMANAMAACDAALKNDLSQTAIAGTLVNRGLLKAAAHDDVAAIADFDAGLSHDANLSAGYMSRGAALLRSVAAMIRRAPTSTAPSRWARPTCISLISTGAKCRRSGRQ